MGRLMEARIASTTRRVGNVVLEQTTVLYSLRSATTIWSPGRSASVRDPAPALATFRIRSISATRLLPSSSPHADVKFTIFRTLTSRNRAKSVFRIRSSTVSADRVIDINVARRAPADVPHHSMTSDKRPVRSMRRRADTNNRQRVPPPANTRRFGCCCCNDDNGGGIFLYHR